MVHTSIRISGSLMIRTVPESRSYQLGSHVFIESLTIPFIFRMTSSLSTDACSLSLSPRRRLDSLIPLVIPLSFFLSVLQERPFWRCLRSRRDNPTRWISREATLLSRNYVPSLNFSFWVHHSAQFLDLSMSLCRFSIFSRSPLHSLSQTSDLLLFLSCASSSLPQWFFTLLPLSQGSLSYSRRHRRIRRSRHLLLLLPSFYAHSTPIIILCIHSDPQFPY